MNDENLSVFRTHLETKDPRYVPLLSLHAADPHNWDAIHELLFAYLLDKAGIPLDYERSLIADNRKTVDFVATTDIMTIAFELVRINYTTSLKERIASVGRKFFGAIISSNNPNPQLDSAGQLIRLQEKLCGKADKFPLRRNDLIAVVVADCTEVQLEMFDVSDASTTMLGRPQQSELQEIFHGRPVRGLFEEEHSHAHSDRFRERIDAVLFIRSIRGTGYRPVIAIRPGTLALKREQLITLLSQVQEYHELVVV